MKQIYPPLFSFLILNLLSSCHKSPVPFSYAGDWAIEARLTGPARSEAVAFVIDNFAYLGTGWDGLNTHYNDLWKYDPVHNTWSQVSSMPAGTGRSSAIGFSANGKGYVGTGFDGQKYLNDFYQYDPASDSWTQKTPFPGSPRYEAVAFGIGNLGYVGTGYDGTSAQKDFYQYDPAADKWTTIGFNGNARYGAVTWVYNNQAYLVTGVNSGIMQTDFWVFDPASGSDTWTSLRPIYNNSNHVFDDGYTTIARWNASAFVIGNQAYLSTGENGVNNAYTWDYDMSINQGTRIDLWVERTPFEGAQTTGAVGFSLNGTAGSVGYIATGRSTPGQAGSSSDLWRFYPNTPPNPNDN
jgi:hypothetical protein